MTCLLEPTPTYASLVRRATAALSGMADDLLAMVNDHRNPLEFRLEYWRLAGEAWEQIDQLADAAMSE